MTTRATGAARRIAEFAFQLAERRNVKRKVTCVDKANIFKSYAFFRKVFCEVADRHPTIARQHTYIDAQALCLLRERDLDMAFAGLAELRRVG